MNRLEQKNLLAKTIETIGLPTGSRVWNVGTENSDYDFVVFWQDLVKIVPNALKLIELDKKTYRDKHMRSYRFIYKGCKYNIISVWQKKEFEVFKVATKLMDILPIEMIKNKENRIEIFTAYKNALRETI